MFHEINRSRKENKTIRKPQSRHASGHEEKGPSQNNGSQGNTTPRLPSIRAMLYGKSHSAFILGEGMFAEAYRIWISDESPGRRVLMKNRVQLYKWDDYLGESGNGLSKYIGEFVDNLGGLVATILVNVIRRREKQESRRRKKQVQWNEAELIKLQSDAKRVAREFVEQDEHIEQSREQQLAVLKRLFKLYHAEKGRNGKLSKVGIVVERIFEVGHREAARQLGIKRSTCHSYGAKFRKWIDERGAGQLNKS